jgi:hypothetical protein
MNARNVQLHRQRLLSQRAYCPMELHTVTQPGVADNSQNKGVGKVYLCQYWTVCRASYLVASLFARTSDLVVRGLMRVESHHAFRGSR